MHRPCPPNFATIPVAPQTRYDILMQFHHRLLFYIIAFSLLTTSTVTSAAAPSTSPSTTAATRPSVEIFPIGDTNSVVYVLPVDGSLLTSMDSLHQLVLESVSHLKASQKFNIIFIEGDTGRALSNQSLSPTLENRRKADDFLNTTTGHNGDIVPALRLAFAQHPQRLFFLMNGDAPNSREVTEEIRNLNAALKPSAKVQIHTIGWMDHGETYEKWLKDIAAENAGTYRFIDEKTLERIEKSRTNADTSKPAAQ